MTDAPLDPAVSVSVRATECGSANPCGRARRPLTAPDQPVGGSLRDEVACGRARGAVRQLACPGRARERRVVYYRGHDRPRHHRNPLRHRGRPSGRPHHRLRLRGALQPAQERRGLPAPRHRRAPARARDPPRADRRGRAGGRPRGLARVAEPGAARRGLRQGVLRRLVALAAARAREEGAEVGREVRPHRRLARQVRHLAARAARLRHRAPGPRDGPHRLPRPPHLPRRRGLLGLGLRGPRRAGPHQRQLRRRPLRDRLDRPGPRRSSGTRPRRARRARWAPSTPS